MNGTNTSSIYSDVYGAVSWVEIIAYPILLTLSTIGNTLIITVFSRGTTQQREGIYLHSMAISGLIILWLELPIFIASCVITFQMQSTFHFLYTGVFQIYYALYKWANCTFTHFADWLLVIYGLDTIIAHRKRSSLTSNRRVQSNLIVLTILILAAFLSSENVVGFCFRLAFERTDRIVPLPDWLKNWDQIQSDAMIAMVFFRYGAVVLVSIILLVTSCCKCHPENTDAEPLNSVHSCMLYGSLGLYLVTHLAAVVHTALQLVNFQDFATFPQLQISIVRFSYIASLCNYSIGFFIYVCICPKFRYYLCAGSRRRSSDKVSWYIKYESSDL